MIKRTLYFGNPAYLSLSYKQLIVRLPEVEQNDNLNEKFKKKAEASIPIEDIGLIILDHSRITITQSVIAELLDNNIAMITCDNTHHPVGMLLNLDGNTLQAKRFMHQIESSQPLKKQLWQQTVKQKINNQGVLLEKQKQGNPQMLYNMARQVRSGDPENHEGRAAAYYWQFLFGEEKRFKRDREGEHPNLWLNYGYSILRACTARALVGSGLLPTLGIHHRNQYNSYCLADDIMEPYRPFVDELICKMLKVHSGIKDEINKEIKFELLGIPTLDVRIGGKQSPLMVALQSTTASLVKCFEGKENKILYPELSL
ncbi:MAG: type II CRISPR-associated endonuclease Cas1 [Bacteroidetes bacterium]|nr:type II CRISPR-associated endonuclease Cas1 [Bacteroidota bacterium]